MNANEYQTAKQQLEAYELASSAYRKENKTNSIPVGVCKTFPFADVVNNDLRSEIETYEFINDRPSKYFLYIKEETNEATTWMGQRLGSVTFGREFMDNFGGKRVPIWITAINGVKYSGTYFKSAGDYARVKAIK